MNVFRLTCASIVCLFTCAAASHAAQFTMTADLIGGSSDSIYVGSNPNLGYSLDGGSDAFDQYGYFFYGIGNLSLQRRAEAFTSQNLFRWLDVFTNNTAAPISTTVSFYGNLGSDASGTSVHHADSFYYVTSDGPTSDPVIAHVRGNNAWTTANVTNGTVNENYNAVFALTLAPGESVGILNFAFLARDGGASLQSDVDLAIARGQELVDAPYLDGLTPTEIASIANFTVPEPASLALLSLGSLALLARRRA